MSCEAAAEGAVAAAAGSPIATHIIAAAAIRPLFLYARNRRALRWRAFLAVGTQAERRSEGPGTVSGRFVGSKSVIVASLCLG
jgi:hypothetical protein